jgi:hypothetical protein
MRNSISKRWPIIIVAGSAIFAAAVAETAFRHHHLLANLFGVVFGYAGGYVGYKFCETVLSKRSY